MEYNPETGVVTLGADKSLDLILEEDVEIVNIKKVEEKEIEQLTRKNRAILSDRMEGEDDSVSTIFNKCPEANIENMSTKRRRNAVEMEVDSQSSTSTLSSHTKMGVMSEVTSMKNVTMLQTKMRGLETMLQSIQSMLLGQVQHSNMERSTYRGDNTPPAKQVGGRLAIGHQRSTTIAPTGSPVGTG